MKKLSMVFLLVAICSLAHARDAARDLRRMVGYTIVEADSVSAVRDGRNGEKYVILLGGSS